MQIIARYLASRYSGKMNSSSLISLRFSNVLTRVILSSELPTAIEMVLFILPSLPLSFSPRLFSGIYTLIFERCHISGASNIAQKSSVWLDGFSMLSQASFSVFPSVRVDTVVSSKAAVEE